MSASVASASSPSASAAPAEPLVSLRGIRKAFKSGTVALEKLDLDICDGEFLSLLGPSGCGKSTVLRLIAGLTDKSGGEIQWRGGVQPNLGFVFQEPTLAPWSDVATNVWLPLRLRGISRADAREPGRRGARAGRPDRLREGLSARTFRRHEDARLDRARAGDASSAAADGRTVRRARRNHAHAPQRRSLVAEEVAWARPSFSSRIRCYESVYLSTRITVMAARPGRVVADIPIDPDLDAQRGISPRTLLCRAVPRDLGSRCSRPWAGPTEADTKDEADSGLGNVRGLSIPHRVVRPLDRRVGGDRSGSSMCRSTCCRRRARFSTRSIRTGTRFRVRCWSR